MDNLEADHLFRHHYGKMVAVLTRIFGFEHLELIEDAIQDTFIKALKTWRSHYPENPQAWLTTAAKNRILDLFRKLSSEKKRNTFFANGSSVIAIDELFLDSEIEDSQLRMIFTACHPDLDTRDQIAFALKTISGFSIKEIASALLLKDETVKKRLIRARKAIQESGLIFEIPQGKALTVRLQNVLAVVYLLFNEGFHSSSANSIIQKDLCAEAIRLAQLLLKNTTTRTPNGYALFALMCFHAARLDSKIDENGEIIDLKHQDRSTWYFPLIKLGNDAMNKAVITSEFSTYHYEAAIASEHLKAKTFEETDWNKIISWYKQLCIISPSPINILNQATAQLQLSNKKEALSLLNQMNPKKLQHRTYLYLGAMCEYYLLENDIEKSLRYIDDALAMVKTDTEKNYLLKKRRLILSNL